MKVLKSILTVFIMLVSFYPVYSQQVDGWFKTGNLPDSYEIDKSTTEYNGKPVYYLKSIEKIDKGFGTISRGFAPGDYLGKRVRLSGYIKIQDVVNHAAMWMRVDGRDPNNPLAFDNMYKRNLKGTNDWKRYEIVLDVSDKAEWIVYGALMNGTGQIWISDFSFEVVGNDVPTTNMED